MRVRISNTKEMSFTTFYKSTHLPRKTIVAKLQNATYSASI